MTKSIKTLQDLFIESKGDPISMDGETVSCIDRIKISSGTVVIKFLGVCDNKNGVALKTPDGKIWLSNGDCASLVHVWDTRGLPRCVSHRVNCSTGELRVWNVYKTTHKNGVVTEDSWTGNAGMIVKQINETTRLYRCSSLSKEFNPNEFCFEISLEKDLAP